MQFIPLPFQSRSYLSPSTAGRNCSSLYHAISSRCHSIQSHCTTLLCESLSSHVIPCKSKPLRSFSTSFHLEAKLFSAFANQCLSPAVPLIALLSHSIRTFSAPVRSKSILFRIRADQSFSFPRQLFAFPLQTVLCLSCALLRFSVSDYSLLLRRDSSLFRLKLFFASPARSDAPHFISLPQRIRIPGARRRSFRRSLCRHHPGSDT